MVLLTRKQQHATGKSLEIDKNVVLGGKYESDIRHCLINWGDDWCTLLLWSISEIGCNMEVTSYLSCKLDYHLKTLFLCTVRPCNCCGSVSLCLCAVATVLNSQNLLNVQKHLGN